MKRVRKHAKHSSPLKSSTVSELEGQTSSRDEVEASLERIYRTETGEMPNFGRFDRVRRSFWLRVVLGIGTFIFLLSALAWTGLFALQPLKEMPSTGLRLVLQESKAVTLGKEEELVIDWTNDALQPLSSADIRLTVPPEFRLLSAEPTPTDTRLLRWDLGLVSPHATGRIRLKGLFLGSLGDKGTIQVVANYRHQNTDRDRQVVLSEEVSYAATVLEGKLTLPDTVLPGDTVVLQYSLKNASTQPLENLTARLAIPMGFIPTVSTTIDTETRSLEFRVGTLPAQSLTLVQLPGRFAPGTGGDAVFLAQAGQKEHEQFFPIQVEEKRISVLAGELALRLVANGTSASEIRVTPGEPLRLLAEYQNTSPETLQNVQISWMIEALVDGKAVPAKTLLDTAQSSFDPQGSSSTKNRVLTVQYGKERIPTLASLAPGSVGRIEAILPTLLPKTSVKQATIRVTLQSEIGAIGKSLIKRKASLVPLVVQFKSDASLRVETRYYTEEGAPLGSGPLPPLVGKTTSYRIFWSIQKRLHALDEVEITAKLPRIIAWGQKNQTDVGTMSYDPTTREVRWHIPTVPEDVSHVETSFEVQLTPAAIDAGRFATLLEETSFRAHDTQTNEWVMEQKPTQTTDLQEDEGAKSKGVVRAS